MTDTNPDDAPKLTVFLCGPSRGKCVCRCPKSCGHRWDGPELPFSSGSTATCSLCAMIAMDHDLSVLP